MATVYAPPAEIESPDFSKFYESGKFDIKKLEKAEKEYTDAIVNFCKKASKCPHAGGKLRFPIGDGYATYIVYDYKKLIHLSLGDGYQIPDAYARGLRKADIIQQLKPKKSLKDLFGRE